jgi:hypothetical protein
MISRSVVVTVTTLLYCLLANPEAQQPDKYSRNRDQEILSLNGNDRGKHVSTKVGQEIVVTLQTIGPGQYQTPRVSSPSLRCEGSFFPKEQIPAGPRQVYRFLSVAIGEARIEIPHSQRKSVYQVTVLVKQM